MPLKKLLYIVSLVDKSLAFEWTAKALKKDNELSFILLNPASSPLEEFLVREGIPVKRIRYRGKKDLPAAFLRTFLHILTNHPQIVHAHLFDAQIIGLTCAWLCRVRARIYTRHTSNYHHVYQPSGVKYDRLSNWLATCIVSISHATDQILESEGVIPSKVVKIPHGFDWAVFQNIPEERVQSIKKKWRIQDSKPVIGVIARHIEWKGIQYIIPAFKEFLLNCPGASLVLANASGPYHDAIMAMIIDLLPGKVIIIPFEEDVASLYKVFDIYVHTPVDSLCEAFGQTYIEALVSGVPSVFTLSGVAAEFVKDRDNAIVVPFRNSAAIHDAISLLAEDQELRKRVVENGKRDVISRFGMEAMVSSLEKLYVE